MIRKSVAAGGFYPYDPTLLKRELTSFFEINGSQDVSVNRSDDIVCGVCPHAGYTYSGKTASMFYKELADAMPNRFILVGPNHYGLGPKVAVMDEGSWETPLGQMPVDTELASAILDESDYLSPDEHAHRQEHSIEVQLPFLQYLRDDISFVPISMNTQDLDSAIEVAQAIKNSVEGNVGVIASSDLVHYGASFGYKPVRGSDSEILEWIERNDRQVLTMIVEKDVDGLYDFISGLNYTMCGYGPSAVTMILASNFGLDGTVLDYTNSYSHSKNTDLVVGYGSVIFR